MKKAEGKWMVMKVNKRFYTLVKRENNAQNELCSGSDQQRAMRRMSLTPPNGGEEKHRVQGRPSTEQEKPGSRESGGRK